MLGWAIARSMYMQDYVRAFEAARVRMETVERRDVAARLARGKPDFVIDSTPRCATHDAARDAGVCVVGLPIDQWYHSPRATMPRYEPRCAEHLVFTPAPEQIEAYRAAGYPHVEHLLFGVDVERFNPSPLSATDAEKFRAEVCFIGSSLRNHDPPDSFTQTVLDHPNHKELHRWLEQLASRVTLFAYKMPELLAQMECETGVYLGATQDFTEAKETWCIRAGIKISETERLEVVRALAALDLALYGSPDWLSQLAGDPALKRYRGEASWNTDLPKAMKGAAINVNVSKAMFLTGIAPRIFETLACGRLLLSNPIPAVMAEFEDGREIVFYRSIDDLMDKARYYLAHREEAARVGEAGRAKLVAKHSTRHRVERIVSVLNERGVGGIRA